MAVLFKESANKTQCSHCGEPCNEVAAENFCCFGCEQIYFLLQENDLSQYYNIEQFPGINRRLKTSTSYAFLRSEDAASKLISYQDSKISKVHFTLPDIHCSSCLWLLENLPKLNEGIHHCKVNFLEKKAYISFNHHTISLEELVMLLAQIGYEPELNFGSLSEKSSSTTNHSLLLKIGVAGFSFGNIMFLSFPEYFGFHNASNSFFLGYLNILLAIPVFFYAGMDYLKAAWKDIVSRSLGIHVPLALGMVTLFSRSLFEILSNSGEGYLDSFAGFVLFLLIGQWFKNHTQKSIRFDRDYKSYFPIAVQLFLGSEWVNTSIDHVREDDLIMIKNNEIIPCDGFLVSGNAEIDYSFVTGETAPQSIQKGEKIYAGGRQTRTAIQIKVEKRVDQGYLTQLWQEAPFKTSSSSQAELLLNHISRYFTLVILLIALLTFTYWIFIDSSVAFNAVTAVLIVACPCALALSIPFILGNATRILSKFQFYVRSTETLEKLLDIDTIVFDKTGTITENHSMNAVYSGSPLNENELDIVYSMTSQSSHPISAAIAKTISGTQIPVSDYHEKIGQGITGICNGKKIRLGSSKLIFGTENHQNKNVLVEIDQQIMGHFTLEKKLRPHISEVIKNLDSYKLALLSGDNTKERARMKGLFPRSSELMFHQSPKEKLTYIRNLQTQGSKVMMIGDGLNDAGALKQSNVGLVVAENNNTFTPSCDAIISSDKLPYFIEILRYVKKLRLALYGAFAIAFLYNIIGLAYAVTGNLSPIVAAILMPTSSISIMVYGLISSKWLSAEMRKSDLDHSLA